MADMDPFDLALPAQRVGEPVQAVADDAVDALDARCDQNLGKLICYCFCQASVLVIRVS